MLRTTISFALLMVTIALPCSAKEASLDDSFSAMTIPLSSLYTMELERYAVVEKSVPANEEELLRKGYLFFKPAQNASKWGVDDDWLVVTFKDGYHARLPIPGTPAHEEWQNRLHATTLDAAKTFRLLHGVTSVDVESGRVSIDPWLTLQAYAANDKEWRQLCWARSLTTTLAYLIGSYKTEYGEYPTKEELLKFAGTLNEAAWISPLTGFKMQLQDYQSTMDPSYVHDAEGWEVAVPLFGAGNKQNAPSFFWPGKHFDPGNWMRAGYGKGEEGLGTLLSY